MPDIQKATIFVGDFHDHPSQQYTWMQNWLNKWGDKVVVASYSSGGWEHVWDVSGPKEAIKEISQDLLCASEWADHS
ncbi:hypothetical protein [Yoonia sp. I 8.24]|uniref:hypothetical protein n=1 Tax=Yoonia sp. I 8.24 TaxID=1537229 RepID=UPI001EDE9FC2|nr:hypothetical protein [Yoonia sp. I 8.24]MCG3269504.1 hypothetical protein [Yoonia sp. I 8.24]